jgi:hypothetical protein
MKKRFVYMVLLAVFAAGSALAGSLTDQLGNLNLSGIWSGTGTAVLPDGTIIDNISVEADITAADNLFYGTVDFIPPSTANSVSEASFESPAPPLNNVTGAVTADRQVRAIINMGGSGNAIIDATWVGNTITGIVRDFSDGSALYFSASRIYD